MSKPPKCVWAFDRQQGAYSHRKAMDLVVRTAPMVAQQVADEFKASARRSEERQLHKELIDKAWARGAALSEARNESSLSACSCGRGFLSPLRRWCAWLRRICLAWWKQ